MGGNGALLLEHAGGCADIVSLQGLGKTSGDGHNHAVRWDSARLSEQLAQVRCGTDGRHTAVEVNVLVQVARVTDAAEIFLRAVCERVEGLAFEDAIATPYLLVGSVDEIAAKVLRYQQELGISYFVVRTLDEFAPVIAALR